jgi:hypothetical protein
VLQLPAIPRPEGEAEERIPDQAERPVESLV